MKKNYLNSNSLIPIIGLLLSVFFLTASSKISPQSAGFPRIMAGLLMVCSIASLYQNGRREKKTEDTKEIASYRVPLFCCLGFTVYALGIIYIGYFVSTFIFMMTMMYLLKCRKWIAMFMTTVCLEAVVYFVFVNWLSVRFPAGLLI